MPTLDKDTQVSYLLVLDSDDMWFYEPFTSPVTTVPADKGASGISLGDITITTRVITGTLSSSMSNASVYATSAEITELDEAAEMKIRGSGEVSADGTWTLKVSTTAGASLWFCVETRNAFYLSKAAVNTASPVALDTTKMNKLEWDSKGN
jgi:hypothetical protein